MDLLHHAAVKLRVGLMDAGSVDEDNLGGGVAGFALSFLFERDLENTVDAGSRRLRFMRDDGELLAEESVQQGGLARIGATDNRDETRAKGHSLYYAPWMRRRRLCG